jgi:glycosyltransferase
MKISIITVSYNSVYTIEDAINSVISQTYFPEVEYIIIDGGSTDGTLDILENYKDKFAVYKSEPDDGIYDAMNKGLSFATGDIIGILNSDDLYVNNKALEKVANMFDEHPLLDFLYGDLEYVKKNDVNQVVRRWISEPYYPDFFNNGNVPPHPTMFLHKRVYLQAGIFDTNYKLAADYEYMLRICKKFNFNKLYLPGIMVKMRLGGATNQSVGNIFLGNLEIIKAWKNNSLSLPFQLIPRRLFKRFIQFF